MREWTWHLQVDLKTLRRSGKCGFYPHVREQLRLTAPSKQRTSDGKAGNYQPVRRVSIVNDEFSVEEKFRRIKPENPNLPVN
jgi:hypothetical protein